VTAAGPADPSGGAESRATDGADPDSGLVPAARARGLLLPRASSVPRCRWCDRPSAGPSDPQHAPCRAAELRMDRDLKAARRSGTTTDLLTVKW
jgi:hypothetical protein